MVGERLDHRERAEACVCTNSSPLPSPSAVAAVASSAAVAARRTPALAVEIGRLTNTGNRTTRARSFLLRTTTESG
jgi:hypothetical protein